MGVTHRGPVLATSVNATVGRYFLMPSLLRGLFKPPHDGLANLLRVILLEVVNPLAEIYYVERREPLLIPVHALLTVDNRARARPQE
jgi:hypothetical protein